MTDYGPFEGQSDVRRFEQTLEQMGIRPGNLGKTTETLPALPASDPGSINRNLYNGFYQYGAKEFWDKAEVTQQEVQDFKKCQHYLMKRNNEAYCNKCNIGWIVNDTFQVTDGKLYIDGQVFGIGV